MRATRRAALAGAAAIAAGAALAGPAARWGRSQLRARRGLAAFAALVAATNAGDLAAARSLCSSRYLARHPPALSPGGGVAGIPRNIHPNFRAWAEGDEVRVCPTNRVGPVYRLVLEAGAWRFDGPAGYIRSGWRVEEAAPGDEFP